MVENILFDRTEIDQIKVEFDLQDLWRKRFPNRKQFTWSNGQQTHQSRIDRIYIPSNWITKSSNANILPFSWSDHDLVTSTFDLPQNSIRGPGTWKLNTSVLQEQAYKELISKFLKTWRLEKERFRNLLLWWDMLKLHVQSITQDYCASKSQIRNQRISDCRSQYI